jgi:hypothetical protein
MSCQQQNKTCKGCHSIRKSWEFLNEKGKLLEKMNDASNYAKNMNHNNMNHNTVQCIGNNIFNSLLLLFIKLK